MHDLRSGAPGELASLGVDLHLFAFFDEKWNRDLETGLESGRFCDTAGRGVASHAWFGVRHGQLHVWWELDADWVAVVLVNLHGEVVDQQLLVVPHRVGAE